MVLACAVAPNTSKQKGPVIPDFFVWSSASRNFIQRWSGPARELEYSPVVRCELAAAEQELLRKLPRKKIQPWGSTFGKHDNEGTNHHVTLGHMFPPTRCMLVDVEPKSKNAEMQIFSLRGSSLEEKQRTLLPIYCTK